MSDHRPEEGDRPALIARLRRLHQLNTKLSWCLALALLLIVLQNAGLAASRHGQAAPPYVAALGAGGGQSLLDAPGSGPSLFERLPPDSLRVWDGPWDSRVMKGAPDKDVLSRDFMPLSVVEKKFMPVGEVESFYIHRQAHDDEVAKLQAENTALKAKVQGPGGKKASKR